MSTAIIPTSQKIRAGFSEEILNQFSIYADTSEYGIKSAKGTLGRVFKSDVGDCCLARLDKPQANPKGKGFNTYLQSEGKGERFFKHFIADEDNTSVIIVEGIYKAFACWMVGKNAIAYSGILGALDGRKLHSGLTELLDNYTKVQIGYDIDNDLQKQLYVEHHVDLLAKLLNKADKTVTVTQSWLKELGKDFDEILVKAGVEKLTEILSNEVKFFDWLGISALNSYTATKSECTTYISDDVIRKLIKKYKVIFLNAPMGAGKNYQLSETLKKYVDKGALVITPLISLGRQIAKDLKSQGVDIIYRDDMDATDNWNRIICCLESIKEKSKLKIKADGSQMQGKIFVIDEVVKVIINLLEGSTISNIRAEVVNLLTAMLKSADKCIFMSADLTDFHCDTILKLLGDSVSSHEIAKYKNTLGRNTFKGYFLKSIQEGLSLALQAINDGKRVFIGIDSQKTTSTYGTGNLAELFTEDELFDDFQAIDKSEILIIDSKTTNTKGHEAYDLIQKGNKAVLKSKKLVLVSPSVEAGFNLTKDEYSPDLMLLCHMGCTSPLGLMQLSMRVRNLDVPRYFCFGGYIEGNLKCGGAITKGAVKKYIAEQIKAIESATNAKVKNDILKKSDVDDVLNLSLKLDIEGLSLEDEFYSLQAINNLQMLNRKFVVATYLRAQGAEISEFTPVETVAFTPILQEIKERRINEEAEREFQAPNLTDKQVETLKDANALTVEQQDSMSKYYAQKTYKYDDVDTQDLIDKKKGKLASEELGIWLQEAREYAEFHEQERILRLQNVPLYNATKLLETKDETTIYKQDVVKGAKVHKILLAEELGFDKALKFAQTNDFSGLWLGEIPSEIATFLNNLKQRKSEWILVFSWTFKCFKSSDSSIFEHVLNDFGFCFGGSKNIRLKVKEDGKTKTKQKTVYTSVEPIRSVKARDKYAKALVNDTKTKYDKYIDTQLWVNAGRRLMANESVSKLLVDINQEVLLESAKRLPAKDFGLSKLFEVTRLLNNFDLKVDIPITIVNPDNVDEFEEVLENWFKFQTEIGFDSETYESTIHKEFCTFIKGNAETKKAEQKLRTDMWYWHNNQTGKRQPVKPGLDQNHNQVRLMQFSDGNKTYVIDFGRCDAPAIPLWFKSAWKKIIKLGEHNTFVGHNIKFDTSSVRKYGLVIKQPYCTMITAQLIFGDCGAGKVLPGGNGLKPVSQNLLGLEVDKTEQLSDWGAENLRQEQITYAAKDAVLAIELKRLLQQILENPTHWGLKELASPTGEHANLSLIALENKNIYHATEMQWRGVPVDVQKLRARIQKLEALRTEVEADWQALKMPCTPQQAKKIANEMNKRYIDRQHPLDPQEMADALGVDLEDSTLELPTVDKPFTSTAKDAINDNEDIPEFQVLKAWRAYNTAVTQLSKVLLSAQINNGVCRTEYKPLSGTGRMSCGNEYGLGTPNLQAFVKKAEGKFYGFFRNPDGSPKQFWSKPSVEESVKIRDIFALTDTSKAFFTEDANASHFRLAAGFGQCEFSKMILADDSMDAHSMFAMMALQAMLAEDTAILDGFPEIKYFVKGLTQEEIRSAGTCKKFKELDSTIADSRFRNAAKTLFYSVLNGAQADKMRKVLSGAVGRAVSIAAGTAMFDAFWKLYQGIGNYIKKILEEAASVSINFNGREFNITTLPDGVKLLYARKDGELATTNIIACQWSRSEATALKKVMASVEEMPQEWGATLINMVHDEVGVTCSKDNWQDAYRLTSDQFAKEYDVFLKGFIPCDQPTEVKLQEKTHLCIPVAVLDENGEPKLDDKGKPKITNLQPTTANYSVKVGETVTSTQEDKKSKQPITKEVVITCERFGSYWTLPSKPYIPTSWADK